MILLFAILGIYGLIMIGFCMLYAIIFIAARLFMRLRRPDLHAEFQRQIEREFKNEHMRNL